MSFLSQKQTVFKVVDRCVAVFSCVLTSVYLSALIFVVLSQRFGNTRVIAMLTQMFPSRELESVVFILVCLIVAGAVTMWIVSDNNLSFLVPLNALLSLLSAVFFFCYTRFFIFIAVMVISSVYLLLGVWRAFMLRKNIDREQKD